MFLSTFIKYRRNARAKHKGPLKRCLREINDQECTQYFAKEMHFLLFNYKGKFLYCSELREHLDEKYPVKSFPGFKGNEKPKQTARFIEDFDRL